MLSKLFPVLTEPVFFGTKIDNLSVIIVPSLNSTDTVYNPLAKASKYSLLITNEEA